MILRYHSHTKCYVEVSGEDPVLPNPPPPSPTTTPLRSVSSKQEFKVCAPVIDLLREKNVPLFVYSKGKRRFWGVITRTRIAFESFGCMGMFSHPLCFVSCKQDFRVCPVLRALSNVLLSRFLVSEGCVFFPSRFPSG